MLQDSTVIPLAMWHRAQIISGHAMAPRVLQLGTESALLLLAQEAELLKIAGDPAELSPQPEQTR